ncbi:MAG: hypothetical protein H6R15_29 [Proteobacteria bacterium]|nr:hypothetical protein [Pseudomonadota bacterium]
MTNITPPRPQVDFYSIVSETYRVIIKNSVEAVGMLHFDDLLNTAIRAFISEPEQADTKLLITDKFYLYRCMWKSIIETLYNNYLPAINYRFEWEIEITPYTITLCALIENNSIFSECALVKKLLNVSDDQFETDYDSILNRIGANSLGFADGIVGRVPKSKIPEKRIDQLKLLFRLMSFPPLEELAVFYVKYGASIAKQAKELSDAFPEMAQLQANEFKLTGPLHNSFFHIDHSVFSKYGLSSMESNEGLSAYHAHFSWIRNESAKFKEKIHDNVVCACCGSPQKIALPEEIMQFKFLTENRALAKDVGFLYIDDYINNYKNNISSAVSSLFSNLNDIKNPGCLILVEGESEEFFIPLISLRRGFLLSKNSIKVYNSKSKQKLEADFLNFKSKYKTLKIICILDSDAKKEFDNISRIEKNNLNKYRVFYIKNGCFEDLFDLDVSVSVLNEMYPDGCAISASDFHPSKDFLSNVGRILHDKKKATFDKVKFAKKMAFSVDPNNLPSQITALLDVAQQFTAKKVFVSD